MFRRAKDRTDERRAVIDIGSNTVRLVIYGGPPRAPAVLWNEKVSARLGRDLARSNTLPVAAMDEALAALARFSQLVHDLGIEAIEAVATAAARDADNGPDFLASVRALGIEARLLSGEEEARASAFGAIGAFPQAQGIVADLGGGSLELVPVDGGICGTGVSLPLGTLRLPALRGNGFAGKVEAKLAATGLSFGGTPALYMIGGTWRALAIHAMRAADHPLTDPHGFRLDAGEAAAIAKALRSADPDKLTQTRGISTMRAETLPHAAALLGVLLDRLRPDAIVFSSWGLREGLHFSRLAPAVQALDPLLEGVRAFAPVPGVWMADAARLFDWTAGIARDDGAATARLRLAAAHLAPALQGVEPNLRAAQAVEWALDKRWIGIDPAGRGLLAAMLIGSLGQRALPERVERLAPAEALAAANGAGLALRLAIRLGAGSAAALESSRLTAPGRRLCLSLSPEHAALAAPLVGKELTALATALDRKPELTIDG